MPELLGDFIWRMVHKTHHDTDEFNAILEIKLLLDKHEVETTNQLRIILEGGEKWINK